jgi:hypothetical protein
MRELLPLNAAIKTEIVSPASGGAGADRHWPLPVAAGRREATVVFTIRERVEYVAVTDLWNLEAKERCSRDHFKEVRYGCAK